MESSVHYNKLAICPDLPLYLPLYLPRSWPQSAVRAAAGATAAAASRATLWPTPRLLDVEATRLLLLSARPTCALVALMARYLSSLSFLLL